MRRVSAPVDLDRIEVIAPNFKRRLSGVTSTLERVLPVQARQIGIAALGPGLSADVPRIGWRDLPGLWRRPAGRPFRIWHARRNIETLAGLVLRDLAACPIRVVFTSASQRRHTRWSRFLISRVDEVISTSAATAAFLSRPSIVVRHGIDADLFHPPADRAAARAALGLPDKRLVGCFGRIRAQKGTDVFVEAMLRMLPSRPDVGAVVLGRATAQHADFLDGLKQRVASAGLADRIIFAPEVAPSQTPAWYRALDIFVAPQRWEGFGVTPLEAMASGVPVVATRVGAFPELVDDGVTGTLIEPGGEEEMVRAVAALLDDSVRSDGMGRAGRARAHAEFAIEREAERINAVYDKLWRAGT